jgi:hypothetical protein
MKGREISPLFGWIAAAVVLVIAGYFIWSATGPSTVTGGKPNERDQELLRGMQEARERTKAGRGSPSAANPSDNAQQPPSQR